MSVQKAQSCQGQPPPAADPFDRAVAFDMQGRPEEAAEAYREMLARDYRHELSWLNLGTILRKQGKFDAALACTGRAVELSPGNPYYLMNYANCLIDVSRAEEGLEAYTRAVRERPGDFVITLNHARALAECCRFEDAIKQFDAAEALKPGDPEVLWDRSRVYLHLERFREGWEGFEARLRLPGAKERPYRFPRWRGESLAGKTILVEEEQGYGDTILCSRYIPLIKARGARVILSCRKELHRLFQAIPGVDLLVAPVGRISERLDYHVSMLSLPGIFGTDLTCIPPSAPLHIPQLSPEAGRLLDRAQGMFKVGIVWSGNPQFILNHRRAVPATRFLPLAEIPGVQLFSLQKGPFEKDLAGTGAQSLIMEMGPRLKDFADTAAVLKHLDLVIMTDSAVAHLAGSLGVPVWNLLSFRAYWLYLQDREDCPWYPSMRLIRQPEHGGWTDVFRQVQRDLKKMTSSG